MTFIQLYLVKCVCDSRIQMKIIINLLLKHVDKYFAKNNKQTKLCEWLNKK